MVFLTVWLDYQSCPINHSPTIGADPGFERDQVWQAEQKKLDRPACTCRSIVPLHPVVGQFWPVWS
jgi:hypothetical protein